MVLFNKSRKSTILNATNGLYNLFVSRATELYKNNKITEYEQYVLIWLFSGTKTAINTLLEQEGFPLYKISDNKLGVEGNALNAYYKLSIFLLYLHEQRVRNKKELAELADTSIKEIGETLSDLLSLEKNYVRDYISTRRELQEKFEDNTLDVINYQMYECVKDLMADGREAKELFDTPEAQLIYPIGFTSLVIEHTKVLDKLLGLKGKS